MGCRHFRVWGHLIQTSVAWTFRRPELWDSSLEGPAFTGVWGHLELSSHCFGVGGRVQPPKKGPLVSLVDEALLHRQH